MTATLNTQQQEAIAHSAGPLLIIAGAGSGKTMVLTHKIRHLIQTQGLSPNAILAITFTNKAAKEMKERVRTLLGETQPQPWIATFHAFCAEVLRKEFHHLGRSQSFVILDSGDQQRILKDIIKSNNLDEDLYSAAVVSARISGLKNKLVSPEDYRNPSRRDYDGKLADVYQAYQYRLRQNNAMDFDDLIFGVTTLFVTHPAVLEHYQNRFRSILVDEYQDTNHAQYILVQLLAKRHQNLCVVGDFDQNIYSWRGANIQNILNFEQDYPTATVIRLEQNYRSTQTILDAANAVIENNTQRQPKVLWTDNNPGTPIVVYGAKSDFDEAEWITHTIEDQLKTHDANDVVILFRTNAQSRALEEQLQRKSMAYRLIGGLKFFARAEIKDFIAYLRLIVNPQDRIAFARVANRPTRGMGEVTVQTLLMASQDQGLTFQELLAQGNLPLRNKANIQTFLDWVETQHQHLKAGAFANLGDLLKQILDDTQYATWLGQDPATKDEKLDNLYELIAMGHAETDAEAFLNRLALATDGDQTESTHSAVTLMTIHHAKGLEFPIVFVCGLEEKTFPHIRSLHNDSELEEERRLCYVALTRAKEKLFLTYSGRRQVFGEVSLHEPSRFLAEIPSRLLQTAAPRVDLSAAKVSFSLGKFTPVTQPVQSFDRGETVYHRDWGQGQVIRTEGEGEKMVIHVNFSGSLKSLIAKYAPLTKTPGG
ncbi:MAG: ATP-dependent helicase [Candidatus Margulisiibacteriota bacterium]